MIGKIYKACITNDLVTGMFAPSLKQHNTQTQSSQVTRAQIKQGQSLAASQFSVF